FIAPLGGIANAFVWPALQAQIGDESGPGDLEKNLGTFSLSWGVGKTLGFFVGGLAYAKLGIAATLGCSALSLALLPLVPTRARSHAATPTRLVADGGPSHEVRAAYLRAAWIANFGAYGLGAILNFLYEDVVISLGRDHYEYNLVLGTVFLAQTVAFWAFGRYASWRYRAGAFLTWQAIGAVALLAIGLGAPRNVALVAAMLVGTATGFGYAASIYYSVHSDESRGHRAGIHEAVLGASNFSIPLAGGAIQRTSGWAGAPYALGAAIVAGTIAIQIRVLNRARRTT
ncbi:MAG: hypothetical protein HYR85_12590, partial [Planctomycetes bacterium]|nr:hypothetical protein [Planctomycetota bacterium]